MVAPVAGEVRKAGRSAADLTASYQDRAVALIREAVRRYPAGRRAAFVCDQILADPALQPLQRRLRSLQPDRTATPPAV